MFNLCDMEFSRRNLLALGAASVTAAGASLLLAPVPNRALDTPEQPLAHGTAYDQQAKQQNPDNKLGCPLGKGI